MKTLVLIDNDADSRALFCECLMGQDWRVVQAEDGDTGLDLIAEHHPAAVVCDLRVPGRNGFQVCEQIRKQKQLSDTRVVLTGVSRFASDRNHARTLGADTYLPKPIMPGDLLKALDHVDGRARAEAEPRPVITGRTVVRFWGVRGSIPSPGLQTAKFGGNTSCVEVRVGELIIVLDAGSGIRGLGQSLMQEFGKKTLRVTMLITHTHWDHIQGFPFFVPAYSPTANVRILGSGAVHTLRNALGEQMQDAFFPVRLDDLASHVVWDELTGDEVEVDGIKVRSIHANHPAMCRGYRICTPQGDVVYMPDHEGYERNALERQKLSGQPAPALIADARRRDQEVVEFFRDADVVITDTQYDTVEYPSRLDWGHSCVDDVVELALQASVRQLYLFHHDPDHNDAKMETMIAEARKRVAEAGSNMEVSAAREGGEIVLE